MYVHFIYIAKSKSAGWPFSSHSSFVLDLCSVHALRTWPKLLISSLTSYCQTVPYGKGPCTKLTWQTFLQIISDIFHSQRVRIDQRCSLTFVSAIICAVCTLVHNVHCHISYNYQPLLQISLRQSSSELSRQNVSLSSTIIQSHRNRYITIIFTDLFLRPRSSEDGLIFPPNLLSATDLPWEIQNPKDHEFRLKLQIFWTC